MAYLESEVQLVNTEELLYDRLERQYKYVPGGPFKVWRTGPPFPAPEAPEPAAIDESPVL